MTFYESMRGAFETILLNPIALKAIFALGIIIIGVIIGKLIDTLLRRLIKKIEIDNHVRSSFIELFLFVIRWTIYITFINGGLNQLGLESVSTFFSTVLITIPTFTGALLLLVLGIGLANYLKRIIKNSEIKGWEFMSQVIFYFVVFMIGIYALKIALIPLEVSIRGSILVYSAAIALAGVVYYHAQRELKRH